MNILKEMKLRDFWYPVAPMSHIAKGPLAFTLLGQQIVIWKDEAGNPAAAMDQCCHRGAQLSNGWVDQGRIICPYHAWNFNQKGECTKIPQLENQSIPKSYRIQAYHCKERYGHIWVCLGTPEKDIPEIPEAQDSKYRSFPCFWETWNTSSMRVIENELDMAHFAVVHKGTFGNPDVPLPLTYDLKDVDPYTVHLSSELSVKAPPQQMKNTRANTLNTTRLMNITWYFPFLIRLQISYPSGLNHIILNHPTPINDHQIQVVQFCFRNDTENEATIEDILKFERLILNEDRFVLEKTCPVVPLSTHLEAHISTDKAGLLVRKKIAKILKTMDQAVHSEGNLQTTNQSSLNI